MKKHAPIPRIIDADPVDHEILSSIAIESKRHWKYEEELIQLWKDNLTVSSDCVIEHIVKKAVLDNRIVGFYAVEIVTETECELAHFWVLPEFIGKGIGKLLFDHAVAAAKYHHFKKMKIIADPYAATFYEHMGAVKVGSWESVPSGRFLPHYEVQII